MNALTTLLRGVLYPPQRVLPEPPRTLAPKTVDTPHGRLAYPALSLDELMDRERDLIRSLHDVMDLSTPDRDHLLTPMIERYAGFVHLLPASEAHHHSTMGGLLHHGLEVSVWAVKASYAITEDVAGPLSERRDKARIWRLALALGGLLHDIGKPAADLVVTDQAGAVRWNPYRQNLIEWTTEHRLSHYYPSWRPNRSIRHRFFSVYVILHLFPPAVLQRLGEEGPELLEALLNAMTGTTPDHPMARLVHEADMRSAEMDLKHPSRILGSALGIPIENYLLHAIRVLLRTGEWSINQPGALLWLLEDGRYLVWPRAITPILEVLKAEAIPGIPKDPEVLTAILVDRGLALQRSLKDQETSALWPMQPACLEHPLSMLKLRDDLDLLEGPPRTPLPGRLIDAETVHDTGMLDPKTAVESALSMERMGTSHHPSERPSPKESEKIRKAMPLKISPNDTGTQARTIPLDAVSRSKILPDQTLLNQLLDPLVEPLIGWHEGTALLPHPETAKALKIPPVKFMSSLDRAGWLIHDLESVNPRLHRVGQYQVLRLRADASNLLREALELKSSDPQRHEGSKG